MKDKKNQYPVFALSITNMILRAFLQGLIPLYPFLMMKLTNKSSDVGIFLSLSYVMLFLGTYMAGVIVPKYILPKTMLVITLVPVAFAISGYGLSNSLFQFDFCGCFMSFFLGLHVCSNGIMMGYYSTVESVNKNFSSLAVSSLLATVLGGFIVGPLLTWLGYLHAFYLFSTVLILCTLFIFPLRQPEYLTAAVSPVRDTEKKAFKIDRNLWLLLIATLLISLLLYGFKMSISIMLKKRGWNIKDISILMAVGTAMALPITIWWGKISNYYNAKKLLFITFCCGLIAYSSLFFAGNYVAGIIGFGCISVVAYTITIPLMSLMFVWYDKKTLPRAQALSSSSVWIAAIIGFGVNGFAMEHLSEYSFITVGIAIALGAMVVLGRIKVQNF